MRVVEVDEAQLHRRRNGCGRLKKELWVLGGVERPRKKGEIPKVFFEILPNRHRQTIIHLIRKRIHRGSIICSDCFTSYRELRNLGYYHLAVNHKYLFVDGTTRAHTQSIEGLWHVIRRTALPLAGAKRNTLRFLLSTWLFHRKYGIIKHSSMC